MSRFLWFTVSHFCYDDEDDDEFSELRAVHYDAKCWRQSVSCEWVGV